MSRQEIFFGKFIALLTQYHTQERSVTFYAEKLCITPKYFSTLIKKQTGKSAAQWIDDYVILEAKNLLKFSGMSIQEIAYHLNFSTQSFSGNILSTKPDSPPANIDRANKFFIHPPRNYFAFWKELPIDFIIYPRTSRL